MHSPNPCRKDSKAPDHAAAARRALALLLEAKAIGDQRMADRHARQLNKALDAHLAQFRRERLP